MLRVEAVKLKLLDYGKLRETAEIHIWINARMTMLPHEVHSTSPIFVCHPAFLAALFLKKNPFVKPILY
jgi:hypothetical protein